MTEIQTTQIDGENHRRPYLLFAMIAAVLILLAAGNLIQLLLINPKASENQHEISHLTVAQEEFTCALAKQTADNYRNRAVAPHGGVEPVPHFRRRLFDQRRTLIAALPLHCVGVGKNFRKRVRLALREIDRLLDRTQLVDQPAAPATAHSPPGSTPIAAAATPAYKFERSLGLPEHGPSPPHHSAATGHPSHHPAPSPSPPKHQGGNGGSGGHGASPEEAAPPSSSSPESSPPSQSQPTESAPPAPSPPTEAPPQESPPPPTVPIAPIEKSTGVNVCIENPLLPLCVGVKGTSVTVE